MKRLRRIFMQLASANTPSGYENRVMPYIMKRLMCCGFKISLDKSFNIVAYRGLRKNRKLPLLCAHADTVGRKSEVERLKLAYNHIRKTIHTVNNEHVLGGDDKCGIAIILRLAEIAKEENLRFAVLITRGEENGSGASSVNKALYDIIKYGIVIDRRGESDVVVKIGSKSLCTQGFADWVVSNAPEGIEPNCIDSVHSDASPMSSHVEVVNLSCGYHNPHSDEEYVRLDQMHGTMRWVKNLLKHSYKPAPPEPVKQVEETKSLIITPPVQDKKTIGPSSMGSDHGGDIISARAAAEVRRIAINNLMLP